MNLKKWIPILFYPSKISISGQLDIALSYNLYILCVYSLKIKDITFIKFIKVQILSSLARVHIKKKKKSLSKL